MDEHNINEIFQKSAEREAEAYALFEERYDKQFPMPETPNIRLMQSIGWQFILIMVQSVAAIILAALRTADMFYAAAASSNVVVRWGDAIAAVIAVEGGVVVFATIKSEMENRKLEIQELKSALRINTRLLWTGIVIGVLVSIVAGLGVSFRGFGVEWDGFKWALSITMGVGASIIAWVSGDILGAMLARFGNARALAEHEYRQEIQAREERKRNMWESAPERQIARSQLMELKEYLRSQRAPRPRNTNGHNNNNHPTPPRPSARSNEVRMRIFAYLDEHATFDEAGAPLTIPGPTELQNALGVSKGYASDMINAWCSERQLTEAG